jgi:hypothetical protein
MVFGLDVVHFDLVWLKLAMEKVIVDTIVLRSWRHSARIHLGKLDYDASLSSN